MVDLPSLKDLVQPGNIVRFVRYHDGNLWYVVQQEDYREMFDMLEFPVPTSDIGNATFLATDKALLFMRYIRKHLDLLRQAKEE